jgi:hypothetical protein
MITNKDLDRLVKLGINDSGYCCDKKEIRNLIKSICDMRIELVENMVIDYKEKLKNEVDQFSNFRLEL